MHMTNGGVGDGEGRGWVQGGRQWGKRKQWARRPAAGDLRTRHSVIALDPFVFKWSQRKRGGDGRRGVACGGGGSKAENGLQ